MTLPKLSPFDGYVGEERLWMEIVLRACLDAGGHFPRMKKNQSRLALDALEWATLEQYREDFTFICKNANLDPAAVSKRIQYLYEHREENKNHVGNFAGNRGYRFRTGQAVDSPV